MSEEMKSCATCLHLHLKCDGDCDGCSHSIVHGIDDTSCKCLECRDEKSGKYRYYEENTEVTRALKG